MYLIETWVWIVGDTKPIKDSLKELGCQWHSQRTCWYWRAATHRHRGKMSRYGLGSLAARYGYEQFSGDNNEYGMAAA